MSAALAIALSALAMTLIVGGRYLLSSGGFALATRLKHPGLYRGLETQMRREIGWSLASIHDMDISNNEPRITKSEFTTITGKKSESKD